MADFFVSKSRGSDSTGVGTAANPWATIGKAIGSSPAMALSGSGTDRLVVGAGVYYESVTLALSPSSGNPLEVVGDPDGSLFAAGGYGGEPTGPVEWAAWSSDSTALTSGAFTASGKSFFSLRNLKIFGGQTFSTAGGVYTAGCTDWSLVNCAVVAHIAAQGPCVQAAGVSGPANFVIDRCDLYTAGTGSPAGVRVDVAEAAAEYDVASLIRNCRIFGSGSASAHGVRIDRTSSTGLGKLGTGLAIRSCTFFGLSTGVLAYSGVTLATTIPNTVQGCFFSRTAGGTSAAASGQLVEDYNAFHSNSTRGNVAIGASSISAVRPALFLDDVRAYGIPTARRPFLSPSDSMPKVAVGYAAPPVDRFGRARLSPTAYGAVEAIDDPAPPTTATYFFMTEA